MLSDVIKVSVGGMEIEITKGTTLLEVSKMFNKEGRPAVIAKVGNHFVELNEVALPNTEIEFCDVTNYLRLYNMSAKELITKVIQDVYNTTRNYCDCWNRNKLIFSKNCNGYCSKTCRAR